MVRVCELCPEGKARQAVVYCPADACFLCSACDEEVHSANRLAGRHVRRAVATDDGGDGSSINDDSENALVPDVAELDEGEHSDPSSSEDMLLMSLPIQVPSFEDAAEYDFDFEGGLGGKMPALCAIDDDALFTGTKSLGKSFYGDISWESVVPENIEHVVPDVSAPGMGFFKREAVEVDAPMKVVSSSTAASSVGDLKSQPEVTSISVVNRPGTIVRIDGAVVSKAEPTLSLSSTGSSITGQKRSREEDESSGVSGDKTNAEKDEAERAAEQRKKRRMEALARFRSKRANRSFTKKVRYECRKQLADSRPRVKGRFVRKIEMALFRKYGALYREHLDELEGAKKEVKGDHRVPAI
ncbi:unnamed protein product [Chondrus crispus]|uniref:CCT domain-containing protein n=1 Tax=Chondrus crispus TaxID=2769 RepID=R7QFM0_CHOCR|nr:unnamed protein product [Chondrus crispus]CDF36220.1 unnamed protein product [Chondrus crispus]|eukprot:XP_005716039.1 unnamed protein product [Chondrus crispus]